MLRCWLSALALLLLALPARGEDHPGEAGDPPKAGVAARAIEAFDRDDIAGLEALATQGSEDPWLVADALLLLGRADVASRLADTSKGPATEKLAAYIEARASDPTPAVVRQALREVEAALAGGDTAAALAVTIDAGMPLTTVAGVGLGQARGSALRQAHQLEDAQASYQAAAEAAVLMGWTERAALVYFWAGLCAAERGVLKVAETLWEQRLALVEALGDTANAALTLSNLGSIASQRGDYPKALAYEKRALPIVEALGEERRTAQVLANLAATHARMGNVDAALAALERARALEMSSGGVSSLVLFNLAAAKNSVGAYEEAETLFERVLEAARASGDARSEALALSSLGSLDQTRGAFAKALRRKLRALEIHRRLGGVDQEALELMGIGGIHFALGAYPPALAAMEAALTLFEQAGSTSGVADALGRLGVLYSSLGDARKAIALQERALSMRAEAGDVPAMVELGGFLASAYALVGEPEKATELLTEILEQSATLSDPFPTAKAHQLLGTILRGQGQPAQALEHHEKARSIFESSDERSELTKTLGEIGMDHAALGNTEQAHEALDRGARAARRMRSAPLRATLLQHIAELHLAAGEADRALSAAETALQEVESVLGGLDESTASGARASYVRLYEIGALAAVRADRPADALLFLESGRAGALLESLEIRQEQRWAVLPEGLRREEQAALAAVGRARRAYDTARRDGGFKAIRTAQAALDAALEGRREVAGRIQREAKQQAGLFYPRAAPLEEIQDSLKEGQGLVVYGLCLESALAFVITRDDERVVDLGASAAVLGAVSTLQANDREVEADAALAALRELLVQPLDLGADVKLLLVSPPGPLCYVPWGALLDRAVSIAASGTTHVLLDAAERGRGEGVLALGDPVYEGVAGGAAAVYHRGSALAPLPATRAEVEAIGTVTLLAEQATRAELERALATRKHWRSVHLACHGLIDPERPTLSALALSPTNDHDGFLPALDVLRMQIPTDLAVLSACDTGRGRVVRGEGIVGLTRAFMYAGAPRVLCSLWKVDDEATRVLMTTFYELWAPEEGEGLSAAEALRAAQAHVRRQEGWAHPYYWAAWVLWGLPV